MENEKCKTCKHCKKLIDTDDEKEIAELNEKQIAKNYKQFYKSTKELIKEPKKLLEFVKRVNSEDVSLEEWAEGFLREPKTVKEAKEAQYYCLVEPFEPTEIGDVEDSEDCPEYKVRQGDD